MRYAIVTGSSKGIGKAIAMDLLKKGYFVVFNYASDDEAWAYTQQEIVQQEDYRYRYAVVKKALTTKEAVLSLVAECLAICKHFDCIVSNVGITDRSRFHEIEFDRFTEVMDVNLNLHFLLVQQLATHLNYNSRIVFISSVLGVVPHGTSIAYGVSKAGLIFLAKCLVKEFETQKTTVNVIASGFAETEWQKQKPVEQRKRIEDKVALHRFAQPEEISSVCMSIIDNAYLNGTCIEVNGGYGYL